MELSQGMNEEELPQDFATRVSLKLTNIGLLARAFTTVPT
jgi:hypothetical protein